MLGRRLKRSQRTTDGVTSCAASAALRDKGGQTEVTNGSSRSLLPAWRHTAPVKPGDSRPYLRLDLRLPLASTGDLPSV